MENSNGNKKIATNAVWIIGVKIIQSILSFVVYLLTARYLGPSNYGLISYAASLVAFVVPVMNLGLTNILVQELINNSNQEGKILGTSLLMSFISSLFCVAGVMAFSFIANANEPTTIMVCSLYSVLLIFQALEAVQYWFQAHYISKYSSIATFCAYVVAATFKIYLLASGKNVFWFVVAYIIEYFLVAAILLVMYKKLGGQKLSVSWKLGKQLFEKSKFYIVSSLMVTIFVQTDKIMLKVMLGAEYTGYYSAATTCAVITQFVFTAIIDSFRPAIFEGKQDNENVFNERMSQLYCAIIYLSLAQCIGITVLANPIINILYGTEYSPAIPALRLVVWYTTFSYIGPIRNIWILANNLQKYLWIINLSGAVLNVILNSMLIPLMGIMGAALASLVTQFCTNVIVGYIIKPLRPNNILMVKGLNPQYLKGFITGIRKK